MDASTEYDGTNNMQFEGMDMDTEGYVLAATRTKPAKPNKYAKRVGANKAKRFELDDRSQ